MKPGYKQTEVGVIPEDWEVVRLDELTECLDSKRVPLNEAERVRRQGDHPYCGANGVLDYIDSYLFDEELILLAEDGGHFDEYRTRPIAYRMSGRFWVNNHAHVLRPQHERIDSGFLFASLVHKDIRQYLASGTRAKLNRSELNKVEVAVPPLRVEQEAIAEALSDADALIESLEALIAKKRQIKQGAMQELLTGKRRLPGFSGEWETKRVGSLGATYGGLTGKSKVDFGHGDAVFVPFMNVMSHVQIDPSWMERVDVSPDERQNEVRSGDLLFNGSSETPEELGLCSVVLDESDVPRYLNSFCIGFRVTSEEVLPRYVARYFRGPVGRSQMKVLAQGATRYNLSKRSLCELELTLPRFDEQVAIDGVFADLDSELEALEAKLEKARAIKQGMMQELLTGRTRLVPAEVS